MTDTSPTPADRPADPLLDCLTAAVVETMLPRYGGPQHNTPGGLSLTATPEEARLHKARPIVEAVLAALPAPALTVARQLLGTTEAEGVMPSADRRARYAAAIWKVDALAAVMAVADAEQASLRAEAEGLDEALRGAISASEKDGARLRAEVERRTLMLQASRDQVAQLTADAAAPPAPADRAAVLRAAADTVEALPVPDTSPGRALGAAWALDQIRRLADGAAAGVQPPTTSEAGLSYRLEHRHREEATWRPNTPGSGANWSWQSREKAAQRLAEARDRWPDCEHRLIETTTKVAVRVLPDCLACGHHRCDGDGPCGALLDAWQRCTCTATPPATPPAAPAVPEETQ